MTQSEYARLVAKIAILKEVAKEYPGKTIDNIIAQMEAIKKETSVTNGICVAKYGFFKEIKKTDDNSSKKND